MATPWLCLAQPAETLVEAVEKPPTNVNSVTGRRSEPRTRRTRVFYEDVIRIGGNLTVAEGEHVRDATVVRGDVDIDGTVHGDLTIVLGNVRLGPKAQITDDVTVVLGALQIEPGAIIEGREEVFNLESYPHYRVLIEQGVRWFESGPLWARPLPLRHGWSWIIAGACLLTYALLALLFPQAVNAATEKLQAQPGRTFLVGLLVTFLFLPFMLLVGITVVGLILVPVLVAAMAAAFVFGKTVVYGFAGQRIGAQLGLNASRGPVLAVLAGGILFALIYTVPVIGAVAWCAVVPLGIGSVVLVLTQRFHREAAPVPLGSAVPIDPLSGTAVAGAEAALLPRVGFWQRVVATLLDSVLVGTVVAFIFGEPEWFLPLWVAYHIAMWTWKGTTIGGVVLSLKIVRADGSRVNFGVALVRSLASFFSAAVLFLGFFWAGWSREKQAWHDRIAGTIVVKAPKGTSLI